MEHWLVTLEEDLSQPNQRTFVLAFLHQNVSTTSVARIVEQLYACRYATYFEQLELANDPTNSPYRAGWNEKFVTCGHNPLLQARKVKNLALEKEVTANGLVETITWIETSVDGEPVQRSITHRGGRPKSQIS